MIEGEEQEELLNTLAETPQEEVRTIEEDIYVIGVESLNGQAGDLTLKSINGENLVGEGNIALQTPLNQAQLDAVNSGIDSTKVEQIATNAANITTLQNTKQDNLTQTQLNAVNSGIDQTKVAQIATNTGNISSNTGRITAIEDKIPSAASSSNQLTDKNYVDNSIATNTANYISDNGQPFQSYADLVAYSGPLTNNDYAFVETIDQAGNDIYTRYKYNADQNLWAEEYTITNPYFTSDQWASINSGIAANDVAQIGTNKTDIAGLQTSKQDKLTIAQQSAVDSGIDATKVQQIADNTTAIAGKQDKLTAGTNIQINGTTISATDTKYTAGTGLTLTGTQFSVTEPAPSGFFTDTTTSQTSEGAGLTINGTTEAPFKGVELKGDTFQQTYSGKNLLFLGSGASSAGLTWTITEDTITISGTATGGSSNCSYVTLPTPLPAGDYTFSISQPLSNYYIRVQAQGSDGVAHAICQISAGNTSATSTTNFTTTRVRLTSGGWQAGDVINITLPNKVQLEAGSAATAYEPYVGGIPSPNPDYPQDIQVVTGEQTVKVTGKNLAQLQNGDATASGITASRSSTTGEVVLNGTSTATATMNATVLYSIDIAEGKTYTISANNAEANSSVSMRLNIQSIGSYQNFYLTGTNQTNTFVSGYTGKCTLQVRVSSGKTLNNYSIRPQVELSATASAFEPYQSQTYPISLGSTELAKIGDYQDYIWKDGDDWKIHKEVGKVVLTDTTAFANYPYGTNSYSTTISAMGKTPTNTKLVISDYFYGVAYDDRTQSIQNMIYADGGQAGQLDIRNTSWASSSDLTTWLSTHNTTVYYVLATPTDTQITNADLITQLEALWNATSYNPQTNITSTTPAPNLPAILTIDTFKNNWAGTLAGYQETIKRLEGRVEDLEA